jgi:hypothetical protein
MILCLETSARYFFWWKKTVTSKADTVLVPLLIGISLAQFGIALRHTDAIYYQQPLSIWSVIIASDFLMLFGTLFHLIPAWQLNSYTNWYVVKHILIRLCIAVCLSCAIIAFDVTYLIQ